MKRLGFALLPTEKQMGPFFTFTSDVNLQLRPLSLATPPHVSLLQLPLLDSAPLGPTMQTVQDFAGDYDSDSLWGHIKQIELHAPDWVFVHVDVKHWATRLQVSLLRELAPYFDRDNINMEKDLSHYSALELINYRHCGYPYVGQAFIPHVTVGRLPAGESKLPQWLEDKHMSELFGRKIVFDSFIIHTFDENGQVLDVVEQISF